MTSFQAGLEANQADQLTVFLLGRSRRGTLLTVALADLGDGPKLALAAQEEIGPHIPGQVPDWVGRL